MTKQKSIINIEPFDDGDINVTVNLSFHTGESISFNKDGGEFILENNINPTEHKDHYVNGKVIYPNNFQKTLCGYGIPKNYNNEIINLKMDYYHVVGTVWRIGLVE